MSGADHWAADTSVAIAALDAGHGAHSPCLGAVRKLRPVLAGHAAFEVFSVLTRMPNELTVEPATAAALVERVFGTPVWLSPRAHADLLNRLAVVGIAGGAVYDALVGEAARTNNRVLLTRDLRARRTYDLLGVDYELVG